MMSRFLHSSLKTCVLLLILLLCAVVAGATTRQAVERTLASFDRSQAGQQRQLAARFFSLLNQENFFDQPMVMKASWPADTVRAQVWYCAAQYFYTAQDYDQGINYSHKALKLLQQGNDEESTVSCMSCLSMCYFRTSDYASAIKYAKAVLAADRKTGDKVTISSDLNNIAGIYLASKRPKEALTYALEAIKNSTAAGDSARMAVQMGMASEIYNNMGDNMRALDYASRAYHIDHLLGRDGKAAIRLCQMAAPLMSMGRLAEAQKRLLEALPLLEESGNRQSYSIACNQLGTIALKQGHNQQAAYYFNRALEFFKAQDDVYNESKSQQGLYLALKQANPAQAMAHLERYCQLKDTLYNRDMQEALGEYNAKYKNEELKLKYDRETQMRRTILWASVILIVLAVGIIILLLVINRQRRQKLVIVKENEQMRSRFFANVTHEFRTPLTVIQAAAQEVLDQSPKGSDTSRAAVDILRHEHRLLTLINQILDIAKMAAMGAKASQWRHGDVVQYIAVLCESFRALAEEKQVKLTYSPQPPQVEMDFVPDYMFKIVQNLISNAIKFSSPHGQVLVTTLVKGKSLLLQVADTGVGMTEAQMQHVFKPFYQAADDSRNIGTGIGLSLVKLAAEGMNGTVEVQSAPGQGSTFTVELPLSNDEADVQPLASDEMPVDAAARVEQDATPPADAVNTDDDAVRILIIEDVAEVAAYMKRQLNPAYSYYFASDGQEGLLKAEQLVPDLIVTDVMMPGIDGFELCRRVRESQLLCHIPVIMVTAKATQEDRLRGLEAGADAYLEKPFNPDILNVRVDKLIEQRRMLRQKYGNDMATPPPAATAGEQEAEAVPQRSDQNKAFLEKFTAAVHHEMQQGKVDYDRLAYEMSLSRAQLNRKVKAITGYTTTEIILQIRIKQAKRLLDTTDASVWDVAMQCGVDNYSYFCTLFKKSTGITPMQYRARKK